MSWVSRRDPIGAGSSPLLASVVVIGMLYLFLAGIALLESGIASFGEGFHSAIIDQVANPLSGLFAGLLSTVLVQSSSVSTSAIVGLVGAGTLPVELAVPMVMGANIGTTVTNTLAALGSIRRPEEFRRAFGGATVHDFFNLLAVAVLFPLELATGLLARSAAALTSVLRGDLGGAAPTSPIRAAVRWPAELVGGIVHGRVSGSLAAVILLLVGLTTILAALKAITSRMRRLVADGAVRAMNRVVSRGAGLVGIVIGVAVTVAVQSSSITTSMLVPLLAAGVLTLPNAFPITLGANIGTTITALLASLAVARPEGLTIALVHTLFNVVAVASIYPIPAVRRVPMRLAEALARSAVRRPAVVALYVGGTFLGLPLFGLFVLR